MKGYFISLVFFSFFLLHCSPFQTIEGIPADGRVSQSRSPSSNSSNQSLSLTLESGFLEDDNQYIDRWISVFSEGSGRASIAWSLERSTRYLPMMKSIFRKHGLPTDLVYVPIIESGFKGNAVSTAGAVGYWQFIPSTGRGYGLQIDSVVDERRDPSLSTEAAAKYLTRLYLTFGNWYLALAGYNAGETNISKSIVINGNRNFWSLSKNKKIPEETRHFIPKIIAAIRIAKNPSQYGFNNLNYQEPIDYARVNIKEATTLSFISSEYEIDHKELKKLNPKFKTDSVPLNENGEVTLRVPASALAKQ